MKSRYLILYAACCLSMTACGGLSYSSGDSSESESTNSGNVSSVGDNVNIQSPGGEINNINSDDADDKGDNPDCSETLTNDGPGGFLWKPVSESDGNLAILFPEEFSREFLAVYVELAEEEEEVVEEEEEAPAEEVTKERGTLVECRLNESRFEDGRLIYRCPQPGGAYTGRVFADNRDEECVWEISGDPAERND